MSTTTPPTSRTERQRRDLTWIRQELQTAIALECSTLPLYLSALFSLEVQNYSAYNLIRSVAMEEMVHMAIAANMLAALGGTPALKDLTFGYPIHGLPGGAEPDLEVGLAPLSRRQLQHFMRIERPAFLLRQIYDSETYPTIAVFYADIRRAIQDNAEAVRAAVHAGGPAHQVAESIGVKTIIAASAEDIVDQFMDAIDEIVEQGEGATRGSLFAGATSDEEASHYARFAALYYGAAYEAPRPPRELTLETEHAFFQGHPVAWPKVINTLAVPADGYARVLALDPNASAVTADLDAFDAAYSSILTALDDVWNGPVSSSFKTLGDAVHNMVSLRVLCCFKIMRHQVPATIVAQLPSLYPDEIDSLRDYTDVQKPVFYGPRFLHGTT